MRDIIVAMDTGGNITGVYVEGPVVQVVRVAQDGCSIMCARGVYSSPHDSRPLAEMSEHAKYQYEEVK